MKALLSAATAALAVISCGPAFAAQGDASAQASQTAAGAQTATTTGESGTDAKGPADPNKVICKTIEKTGSHLGGKRTCRTRAAWDEMSRAGREATEHFQNSDSGTNIPH